MAIARFPNFVIDCPDPGALATFYGALLDWKTEISADWAEIRAENGNCVCFQPVADYTPPRCSNSARPSPSTSQAPPSGCSSTRRGTPSASASTDYAGRPERWEYFLARLGQLPAPAPSK
jgi:hypothetical protein